MIPKKFLNILLMSLFIVSFSLAFAPNEASSQLGCCLGPSTNCSGGGCGVGNTPCAVTVPGATCPEPCDPLEDVSCFVADAVCTSIPGNGNDFCSPGCCVAPDGNGGECVINNEEDCDEFGDVQIRDDCGDLPECNGNITGCCLDTITGICTPDQTIEMCNGQGEQLDTSDPSCQTIPFCQIEGCCATDQDPPNACAGGQTATECLVDNTTGVAWTPGAMCLDGIACGDELGCCDGITLNDSGCDNNFTEGRCTEAGGDFFPGEMCNGLFPSTCGPIGCCQETLDPASCSLTNEEDCTGTWVIGGPDAGDACLGDDSPNAGFCERNVVNPGCCQQGSVVNPACFNTVEGECDGTFVDANMCMIDGNCTPLGCCVCGFNQCEETVEEFCPEECTFNEGLPCSPNFDPQCIPPPDEPGCCVLGGLEELAASPRQVDPTKCVETSAEECSVLGGNFKGPATLCIDCPECLVPRNVPTLGQWGLIVIAGLLGVYSLFVITRRKGYNVG